MHASPYTNLGTFLSLDELRTTVAIQLGCKICESSYCHCGKRMNCWGIHGLSCHFKARRFPWHTKLNYLIKKSLQTANISSMLELNVLSRTDSEQLDGLRLCPCSHQQCNLGCDRYRYSMRLQSNEQCYHSRGFSKNKNASWSNTVICQKITIFNLWLLKL